MKLLNLTLAAALAGLVSMPALAAGQGNTECPVGLVKGLTLDDEFGPGTSDITKCIKKRAQVKMVVQLNQGNGYGLNNIANIIDDYEITHGMKAGRDYEIVAILHSPGGMMALKNVSYNGGTAGDPTVTPPVAPTPPALVINRNPSEQKIKDLMARGVKFYFCQNTTRAYIGNRTLPNYQTTGISATDQMIEGMEYTTAGLTSIADFQAQGYQYIQP